MNFTSQASVIVNEHQTRRARGDLLNHSVDELVPSIATGTDQREQKIVWSRKDRGQGSAMLREQVHTRRRQILHKYVFRRPQLPRSYQRSEFSNDYGDREQIHNGIELIPVMSATVFRDPGDTDVGRRDTPGENSKVKGERGTSSSYFSLLC